MSVLPEAVLDGIAARPEDPGAWEVLADYLAEHDLPGATLARCDLELMRGISNPDLLADLAAARAKRPRLPREPWSGYDAHWRCGLVTRLHLDSWTDLDDALPALFAAPALRGLHHLRLDDEHGRAFDPEAPLPLLRDRWALALQHVTPHLRRLSLGVTLDRPRAPLVVAAALDAVARHLPPKLERLDLAIGSLSVEALPVLEALAARLQVLNLDGTTLERIPSLQWRALVDAAPSCRFFFGGTTLSPREWGAPHVEWLAPEVDAWLEHEVTGALVPLTPRSAHDGFRCLSWPGLERHLRRELQGWSLAAGAERLEDGALLALGGGSWRFHLR